MRLGFEFATDNKIEKSFLIYAGTTEQKINKTEVISFCNLKKITNNF